jgi:general secretion pathway protein L
MNGAGILNADMATLRSLIATGLRWWWDELAAIVPRRWRDGRSGRQALYVYDPELGTLEPIPATSSAGPRSHAPAVVVVLPAELTLIRQIDYPAVSERDLARLIDLDRDRVMPQGAEALLAARVLARDQLSGRMQVEVAGLPLDRARALAMALQAAPREPVRLLASAPCVADLPPIDLLPALRRAGLIGTTARSAMLLWLVVGFLFLLNIGLLVWRDSAALDNLAATIDQQQPAVSVAHRIIARMRSEDRIAQQTVATRRSREPVAMMARLDQALPAGTWIQRLSWSGDAIQLAGYHPPRSDVSGALRHAGLAVVRYGDGSEEAPTPLGEPFEVTVRLGKN